MCPKSWRIGCVISHYNLQCGITQPILRPFWHICTSGRQSALKIRLGGENRSDMDVLRRVRILFFGREVSTAPKYGLNGQTFLCPSFLPSFSPIATKGLFLSKVAQRLASSAANQLTTSQGSFPDSLLHSYSHMLCDFYCEMPRGLAV